MAVSSRVGGCGRTQRVGKLRAYQILCGVWGVFLALAGAVSFMGFFAFHAPDSQAGVLPVGPNGAYFMAFTGCALIAWGGCLVGAARRPTAAPFVATASVVGLVLAALYRMVAWIVGDYASLGNVLRVEAAVLLLVALAFVWLRPAAAAPEAQGT